MHATYQPRRAGRTPHRAAAVLLALLGAAAPALSATNLLTNGGFESGFLSPGWTQFGDTSFTDVLNTGPASEGIYSAWFGPSATGGIAQSVALQAGSYRIDFDVAFDGVNPTTSFAATFDGQSLVSLLNPPASTPH